MKRPGMFGEQSEVWGGRSVDAHWGAGINEVDMKQRFDRREPCVAGWTTGPQQGFLSGGIAEQALKRTGGKVEKGLEEQIGLCHPK